jgi:DNA-directed RNA polymerase specialized sigma24 family protein
MSLGLLADADVVARCREGDQQAWNELVTRFSRYVYAITSRVYRLGDHDAEDVFQEVFARTRLSGHGSRPSRAGCAWTG